MKDKQFAIPKATAKRLSLYYRIFKRFHAEKIERANSKQIAEAIGIDSATVRRDFSYFGELGRRGFGYDVKKLMTFFADLLNDNSITNVMLVGIGNMGHALLHYRFHERNKMKIIMAFDLDDHPEVGTQTPDGIPIYGISQIKDKIKDADVKTAILTVPSVKSQEVANLLVDAGVKGFVEGVKDAGGIPIILPIGDQEMACHYISLIDKLILTGGQNVDPKFYGEPKTIDSDDYHLQRDIFELALIKEAIKQKKPIFSVCRGTQLFNVAMGGTLYQDIEDHWQDSSVEYTTQRLVTEPDTVLQEIYGEISHINSFHHQSIKDLAPNLKVVAHDPKDGIIEAVMSTDDVAFLGVQWHPELLFENRPKDKKLFDYVVNEL